MIELDTAPAIPDNDQWLNLSNLNNLEVERAKKKEEKA